MSLFGNFKFGPDGKFQGIKPKLDPRGKEILKAKEVLIQNPLPEGTVVIDAEYEKVRDDNK